MSELNPKLDFVGVLETMTPPGNTRQDTRNKARVELEEGLKKDFKGIKFLKHDIPRKRALADGGLAYLSDKDVESAFDELGDELVTRIGRLP